MLSSFLLMAMAGPASSTEVLPFIDNDYPTAITQAQVKSLPLFVEAWAPW
jgi:hypothetical protein